MEKTIYSIQGYIPSDENVVVMSLYKLCKIGKEKPFYMWIRVNGEGGIGTGTDEHCESESDAIISLFSFQDEINIVKRFSFKEALETYREVESKLSEQLK